MKDANISRETECLPESAQQEDLEWLVGNSKNLEVYRDSVVFVTGATGLIGSNLVKLFLCFNRKENANVHIIAAVRDLEKAENIYGELLKRPELELYVGDITSEIKYEKPVDYIFHTASVTASKLMVEHPVCTIETAYQGTRNILEMAKRNHIKGVVYVSSMEVYGSPDPSLETVHEKDLGYIDVGKVRSSYSEGKRICECLCTAYASEFDVPVKIARLAQTFGAGIFLSDNRVYAQFARSAIQGTDIVLHSDGTSEGNYCYIRDVLDALLLLGVKGAVGEAYNVVNETSHMRIIDMAKLVTDQIAHGKIKVVFDIPESALTYGYAPSVKMKLSAEKLQALGWKPSVDIQEMYERMIRDLKW